MVKIKVKNHEEIKISPFAFGNTFTNLNMIDNPVEEDIRECDPQEGTTIFDCENNPYLVENKSITEDQNIVVVLSTNVDRPGVVNQPSWCKDCTILP